MPTDFSADWNGFDLMNAAGDDTFPICTFSYLYIHKSMADSESARLLQAFATFVLSDEGQRYAVRSLASSSSPPPPSPSPGLRSPRLLTLEPQ